MVNLSAWLFIKKVRRKSCGDWKTRSAIKGAEEKWGNSKRGVMKIVKDYNEMDSLEKIEGRKVIVLYSNLIHQVVNGQWSAVGKLDKDGRIIYGGLSDENAKR